MNKGKLISGFVGLVARFVVLVVVFGVAVTGGYLGYSQFVAPKPASTVATVGSLVSNNQAKLSFKTGGKLAELDVKVGDVVKAGAVLAKLDTTDLQQALNQAQISLQNAQIALAKLNTTNPQTSLGQAQINLQNAQLNLAKLQAGPTAQALTIAKAALDKSTLALQAAQSAYDKVAWQSNVAMTSQAQALQSATLDFQSAQAQYQQAVQGNTTSQDIQLQQNAVKLAQIQVDSANASIQAAAQDQLAQQNAVKLAQIQVDTAKANLQGAVIVAPFDGTISSVGANVGEMVGSSPLITIVDLTSMHLEASIAETDIGKISKGQTVNITFDSLPTLTLPGTVTAIAPSGVLQSGVNTYIVYVTPTRTDPRLLAGLTSTANVVIQQVSNVVYVPNRAIKIVGGQKTVAVEQPDGAIVTQQVQTGLSNETNTEITAGLTKGEMVGIATTTTAAPATTSGGLLGGLRIGGISRPGG
jgi:HlyD family secretion protein